MSGTKTCGLALLPRRTARAESLRLNARAAPRSPTPP